ncbi:MAG: tripartite tricarboxylate transporter substrate binding protein [Betaproteobacteria bacterium]
MKSSNPVLGFAAVVALVATIAPAQAQDYPVRQIRIVLPFSPGGGTDLLARLLSKRFYEAFGQTATVDNRPGAGGNLGADIVAKSAPDGYTLLMSTASLAVNVTLYAKLPYDLRRDLIPITQVASAPLVVTVHPSVPARSVKEFVALAKKNRDGLNFGSNGTGTTSHLALVMFNQMAGTNLTHIPYKGAGPMLTALLSGEVELGFPAVISVQPHLRSGRLRALAVTTKRRSTALPEVPTLDASYPGFDIDNWFALFAPAGTPAAVVNRIYAEVVKGLQHPESQAFMKNEGAEPVASTPAEFAAFVAREIEKYAKIVKLSGAKPDS